MDWQDAPLAGPAAPAADETPEWSKAPTVAPASSAKKSAAPDAAGARMNALGEAALHMGTGAAAVPLGNIAGLAAIPAHFAGLIQTDPTLVRDMVQQGLTYQPRSKAGQAIAEYNPIALGAKGLDKLSSVIADMLGPRPSSPMAPFTAGLKELMMQAPMFLGGPATKGVGNAMKGDAFPLGAERWMQSALKPPPSLLDTGQGTAAVKTLLDQGINVSRGGAELMQGRIADLNSQIAGIIENSPAAVDRPAVAARVQDVMDRFEKQVTPAKDKASIQKALDEFNNSWPDQIPVATAQAIKQGTYRTLNDKYTGELGSADIATQKALARGLKEEIAAAVPEVRPLNAEESVLLNTLPLVERRVLREANNNIVGLGILSHSPSHLAAWLADRSALFKSLVARMLNATGGALQDVAPVAGVAGAMMNEPQDNPKRR